MSCGVHVRSRTQGPLQTASGAGGEDDRQHAGHGRVRDGQANPRYEARSGTHTGDSAVAPHRPHGACVRLPQKLELRKFCQANEETAIDKVLLADTDGDGQISKSEWLEAVHSNEWIKRFVCPRMFVQNAQSDMF